MALTAFQQRVCRLLAEHRRQSGESYVAGGSALNLALGATRRSRDIDIFHDTSQALARSWAEDRVVLERAGWRVNVLREKPAFVEALVEQGRDRVLVEWSQDSAYRFFPLVEDPDLGLTMHPFDLATNKTLALVGRREPRDFVDVLTCDAKLSPLGYLAWAAAGKDPGFSPAAILQEAARTARYTQPELDALDFAGGTPSAAELSIQWHRSLAEARAIIDALPPEHAGTCVLDEAGGLARFPPAQLPLLAGKLRFHPGSIRGSFPTVTAIS